MFRYLNIYRKLINGDKVKCVPFFSRVSFLFMWGKCSFRTLSYNMGEAFILWESWDKKISFSLRHMYRQWWVFLFFALPSCPIRLKTRWGNILLIIHPFPFSDMVRTNSRQFQPNFLLNLNSYIIFGHYTPFMYMDLLYKMFESWSQDSVVILFCFMHTIKQFITYSLFF